MYYFTDEQNTNICNSIKKLLIFSGISKNILSQKIYVSRRTLDRLLAGDTRWDNERLNLAASCFDVTPNELAGIDPIDVSSFAEKVNRDDYMKAVVYVENYLKVLSKDKRLEEFLLINNILSKSLILG